MSATTQPTPMDVNGTSAAQEAPLRVVRAPVPNVPGEVFYMRLAGRPQEFTTYSPADWAAIPEAERPPKAALGTEGSYLVIRSLEL